MSKLDDIMDDPLSIDEFLGGGDWEQRFKMQVKSLMKKIYKEAQEIHNHTGVSFEAAFNQKVEEL